MVVWNALKPRRVDATDRNLRLNRERSTLSVYPRFVYGKEYLVV